MPNEAKVLIPEGSVDGVQTVYSDGQDMLDHKELVVTLNVTNVAGTTPSLNVTIEHCWTDSEDNDDWTTLITFTEKGATGKETKTIPDGSTYGFHQYIRVKSVLGGTSPNFTYEVQAIGKS